MTKVIFFLLVLFNQSVNAALEVVPLFNRSASELSQLLQPLLEQSERVIANGSDLIIKASPNRQKELKTLIKKLDQKLSNLSITVVQSRSKTADNLNAAANINLRIPLNNTSYINGKSRGWVAQTRGLDKSDSTQVIKTLDGKPATIKIGKTHPVQNISISSKGNGYPAISSNTQYIEATTGFIVTPRLTGHQVTLEIIPWSDKMNTNGTIDTQSASSTIRVNLNEWVEIGGITQQGQIAKNGTLYHAYSTTHDAMHISIKVEKTP